MFDQGQISQRPKFERAKLREHLEGLAEATDLILKNCLLTNSRALVDLRDKDNYSLNSTTQEIVVEYKHRGHTYAVGVKRL